MKNAPARKVPLDYTQELEARLSRLEAENDDLEESANYWYGESVELKARLSRLEEENARLRKAMLDSCRDDRSEVMGGCDYANAIGHRLDRLEAAARAVCDAKDHWKLAAMVTALRCTLETDTPADDGEQ